MAFQSIEMRKLTEKLESQTEKYLEITSTYETRKSELLADLEADNIDRLQEYDLMLFKEALQDKKKAYHDIQVTREEIRLREIYEKSETIPKSTSEYYQIYIDYWNQKLRLVRIKDGEFSYNRYKSVADYQIGRAKEKLEAIA